MKKLTKKEKFEMILAIAEVRENTTLVEFINHELELLAKKNASGQGNRKPTKTQQENEILLAQIQDHLTEVQEAKTISEIIVGANLPSEISNQKMSALLKKLVDSEIVEKYTEKKKTYFKIK